MALRIGGMRRMEPAPEPEMEEMAEEMPMEGMMEEPALPEEALEEAPTGGGTLDPHTAGYKGPEMGPFMCGNCQYFNGDGTCQIVAGEIAEEGLCNLFTGMASMEEEAPEEAVAEELPVEEEAPEEELAG